MADTSILVSGIEYKVRKLIDHNLHLSNEVERLNDENNLLNKRIQELENNLSQLTQQINKSIIANSLEGEKEILEGRKLIGNLVREIDQCIALLSK
jgi:predicted  nucleic acid-binding Zn-ribbon protein